LAGTTRSAGSACLYKVEIGRNGIQAIFFGGFDRLYRVETFAALFGSMRRDCAEQRDGFAD
jgi:hypothetical protein